MRIFALLLLALTSAAAKTNVIFLLADDLGFGDIGCYGCPDAKTPHIDALARADIRFTQFYANGAECTPTRTALMTGRYPQRAGGLECAIGTGNVGRYDGAIELAKTHQLGLPPKQAVLPSVFKDAGYATGIFGKWHLGYEPHFNPLRYGWDQFFGCLGGNVDYFTHRELSPLPVLYQNDKPIAREGYMTHLITDAALEFIETNRENPFFCYVPFTSPHFPFQTPRDEGKRFTSENWTAGSRASYVTMLEDLDRSVGRIVQSVDTLGLADDTLILFASDHGAMKPGRNLPWNGFKGGLYEGGIRAPLIARWPGRLKPGTECGEMIASFDLTASFARIAGADPGPLKLDGMDCIELAESGRKLAQRTLYWRARRGDRTWWAVNHRHEGHSLKYLRKTEDGKTEEWFFDLAKDPGETDNATKRSGADASKLRMSLEHWEKEVRPVR